MIRESLINTFEFFLLPLVVIYFFNIIFDLLIKRSVFSPFYMILVAPGVIVHEISHTLAAIITGAEIKHINLFSSSGGHVVHSKSKLPIVGQFIISFAPVVGQILAILLISRYAAPALFSMSWHQFTLRDISKVASTLEWSSITTWILIYFIISFCLAIAPSKKDLNNSFLGIIGMTVIVFLLFYTDFISGLTPYLQIILPALWLAVLMISLITLMILPFVILNKILGKW